MMNKARILIVDDEIILSRSLAMAFESKGYEVCHADSGEKALERLEDFSPELVLLDILLGQITPVAGHVALQVGQRAFLRLL